MKHLGTVEQGCPVGKLRFHPRRPLLASVAWSGAEVCIWGLRDDSGAMKCLARIGRELEKPVAKDAVRHWFGDLMASGRRAIQDVAWHPHDDLLALVGGGRPIEFWTRGVLLKTLGKHPESGRTCEFRHGSQSSDGHYEIHTEAVEVPLIGQGYGAVAFSASGDRLVASRFGEDPAASEVYDVATGDLIGSFWRSDTTLVLHPEGEILATLSSDQGASAIRFVRLSDPFQAHDVQINAFADCYARLLFSPTGDALAIVGHAYAFGVKVYRFPECQLVFEADLESWDDIRRAKETRHRRNERDPSGSDAESPLDEFLAKLPSVIDPIAFSSDGRRLLIGATSGAVVEVNLKTCEPVREWAVHDGPVVTLDASPSLPVLATAEDNGRINLWRLRKPPVTTDRDGKPITAAFRAAHAAIDPMTPEDGFRLTDGKRWYDLETIGEEDLDDDAPPWAQIAKMTSLWGLDAEALNERAESDPVAREVRSMKNKRSQDAASDEPDGTGTDPTSD